MLNVSKVTETVKIDVLVSFVQDDGTTYPGEFKAEFRRVSTERIDEMLDAEPPLRNSEMLDELLVDVSGIGDGKGNELPPVEAMAWIKRTPECVNAAVVAFFKTTRPERYDEKTSKKRRGRG